MEGETGREIERRGKGRGNGKGRVPLLRLPVPLQLDAAATLSPRFSLPVFFPLF